MTDRPLIVHLDHVVDIEDVGGKARNLALLRRAGQPVPHGFVVTNAALAMFLDEADLASVIAALCARLDARSPLGIRCTGETIAALVMGAAIPERLEHGLANAFRSIADRPLIVRSSAVGEDSGAASFAGQLDSIGDVDGFGRLRRALLQVWASQWSPRSLSYQLGRNVRLAGMGVIVQQQIRSAVSGVLFTRDPGGSRRLVIEYCAGSGEALVAGRVNPGRLTVSGDGLSVRREAGLEGEPLAERLLDDRAALAIARAGKDIEQLFGTPQDIEWTLDADGRLWIVQSRPITVSPRPTTQAGRVEVHWSNANVNENFPRPISPLLYSIASVGYYHYFRNLGRAFGISKRRLQAMEQPLRHIIGVHCGRMYYNLTSIHGVLRSAPFGELLTASFNEFVGAGKTATDPAVSSGWRSRTIAQLCELCIIAIGTTWQYAFLSKRIARFERTVSRFAAQTSPKELPSRSLADLLTRFRGFIEIRTHRWNDAALADAGSMVCYGVLQRLLARMVPAADQRSLHNNLLKALPDLVSGVPPLKLWELSELVRRDERLASLFRTGTSASILEEIDRKTEFRAFRQQFETFLDEWGFRCSGELMLTMPSFQEEPGRAIELIQAYLLTAAESPARILARQAQERLNETCRLKHTLGVRWSIVSIVLRWTQQSILFRERARLKQALLYSRLRHIVLAIGERLVESGRLNDRDDVFFLTADEIDALLSGAAMFPNHVHPLVALRRTAHVELSAMSPPDTMTLGFGEYFAPETGSGPAEAGHHDGGPAKAGHDKRELRGTAACGGRTEARAAVLDDVGDAQRLASGDVLVTKQTDPGWGPVFPLISGLVIERGGMLSHGAIIAREFGIPSVVGVPDATSRISHGARVQVDGDRGVVRILEEA